MEKRYHILHLSDLHFGTQAPSDSWYSQLAEDLKGEMLICHKLDGLIISGDVANRSTKEEYDQAKTFLYELIKEFGLDTSNIVMVPGNHDLNRPLAKKGYALKEREDVEEELVEGRYVAVGEDVVRVQDPATHPLRFQYFSDFYKEIKGEAYPFAYKDQATVHHLMDPNLLVVGLNSAWQLDQYFKARASIGAQAVAKALGDIRGNKAYAHCRKFAVWHHPLYSGDEDRIKDHGFMQQLAKAGFCVCCHGHIHQAGTDQYRYDVTEEGRKIHIVGAGTFGAPVEEWTAGHPLQYNLLKIAGDTLTVETRCRRELNGAWRPDAIWGQGAGKDPLPRYFIKLPPLKQPVKEPEQQLRKLAPESVPTAEDPTLAADIDTYRKKIAALHEYLPLAGFKTKVRAPLRIEEIYVPLDAMLDLRPVGEVCFSDAKDAQEKVCRMGRSQEISIPDAFARSAELNRRGIVILGDPGAGKTTHLRRLLLWCLKGDPQKHGLAADIVPVFLPLRELKALDKGLDAFIEKRLEDAHLGIPPGFGRRLMARGNLLLLFDGLDEVVDAEDRGLVSRWIAKALRANATCYFAVTCRFAGYTEQTRLDEHFLEMHMRPLKDEQAEAFVRTWYRLVQKSIMTDAAQAEIEAKQKADDLIQRLKAPEFKARRVLEMTRNPLLLTNICLVHLDRGGKLPERRIRLYEECTDVLLELWRRAADVRTTIDAESGRRVLQPVAYWLHQQKGRTRASAQELAPVMDPAIQAAGWPNGSAADFLEAVRNQSGLLTGWDQQNYGFMHLGFQEYLAAGEVRRQSVENPQILRELAAKFGDSWWQEVILLLLAMSDPCLFTPFMRAVVRMPGFAKHSDLVTACLDDAAEVSPTPFVQLLEKTDGEPDLEKRRLAALRILEQHAPEQLASLAPELRDHDSEPIRRWMAERNRREAADTIPADRGGYVLVRILGGEFLMGSPDAEKECDDDEGPQHLVHVPDFYMGRYPVTNEAYGRYLANNPDANEPKYWADRQYNQPRQPVVGVSWNDARQYARWAGLQLPSEAQWEYACRAGTQTRFSSGDEEKDLERAGWYGKNSDGKLHPAGEKEPNAFGLYDMHGNVWEWTEDDMHGNYKGAPDDGRAWIDDPRGSYRVVRGGSWFDSARLCRSAFRGRNRPDFRISYLGFRLVLLPGQQR
jgi:formylglycine-generating enzyme required for sulfatase activity/predicted phosphodiesterase